MVEHEKGNSFDKEPETVEEVSGRIRQLFREVQHKHPEELFVWQSALYDIIEQAQVQYNVGVLKERMLNEETSDAEDRYQEENILLSYKNKRILEKLTNDRTYEKSYDQVSMGLHEMQAAFIRKGTQDHLGATIRELRRVKRSVREL